nr:immunoglobulin heavy chain junction region [Mus musculus]
CARRYGNYDYYAMDYW